MDEHRFFRRIALVATIVLDAFALILCLLSSDLLSLPEYYAWSYLVGILLCVLLSLGLYAFSKPLQVVPLLFFRVFVLFVVSYPVRDTLFPFGLLTLGLALETLARFRSPFDAIGASCVVVMGVAFLLFPKPLSAAAGSALPATQTAADILEFAFSLLLLWALALALKRSREKSTRERNRRKQLEASLESLVEANLGFQHFAQAADQAAAQRERERITREIHDSAGHHFTNLIALTEVAISLGTEQKDRLGDMYYQLKEIAQEGLRETRASLHRLRKTDLHRPELGASLHKVVKTFEEVTGVKTHLHYGNMRWNYGVEMDMLLYRTVQEALTNAFRHGQASSVWIGLWEGAGELSITIRDDGRGAATIEKGIGMRGMEERVGQAGGTMEVLSAVDGFHLLIRLPLPRRGA